MKKMGRRMIALLLAILCIVSLGITAGAADIEVSRRGEPVKNLTLDSAHVTLDCYFEEWVEKYPTANHCAAVFEELSADGGDIVIASNQNGLLNGHMPLTLYGKKSGHVLLTIKLLIGFSETPDAYSNKVDKQYGETEITIAITVPGTSKDNSQMTLVNPFEHIDIERVKNPFSNVSKEDWYYEATMNMYAAGYMHGCDISPDQDGSQIIYMINDAIYADEEDVAMEVLTSEEWVSREKVRKTSNAMGAQLFRLGTMGANLHRLNNAGGVQLPGGSRGNTVQTLKNNIAKAASYSGTKFDDVPLDLACYQAVNWAADKGIVNGFSARIFKPRAGITREQMCAILVRTAEILGLTMPEKVPAIKFTDAGSIQSYAVSAVAACQRAGIIQGFEDGSFHPRDSMTGEQMTTMIYNFIGALGA